MQSEEALQVLYPNYSQTFFFFCRWKLQLNRHDNYKFFVSNCVSVLTNSTRTTFVNLQSHRARIIIQLPFLCIYDPPSWVKLRWPFNIVYIWVGFSICCIYHFLAYTSSTFNIVVTPLLNLLQYLNPFT